MLHFHQNPRRCLTPSPSVGQFLEVSLEAALNKWSTGRVLAFPGIIQQTEDSRGLHLSPSPSPPSRLPGLKVSLKERERRGKNSLKVIWYWDELGLREDGSLGVASVLLASASSPTGRQVSVSGRGGSCCFCTQTSTSHYQLAGQSANSFDRLVGWMEGEYRNSTEGRRKVSPVQADPGQCCLKEIRCWASVWFKGMMHNFPHWILLLLCCASHSISGPQRA